MNQRLERQKIEEEKDTKNRRNPGNKWGLQLCILPERKIQKIRKHYSNKKKTIRLHNIARDKQYLTIHCQYFTVNLNNEEDTLIFGLWQNFLEEKKNKKITK